MAIDIRQAEVLLLTDRSGIKTKTNVNRTNKPSTKSGHLQGSSSSGSGFSCPAKLPHSNIPTTTRENHQNAAPNMSTFINSHSP